jgi:hypothetical protein
MNTDEIKIKSMDAKDAMDEQKRANRESLLLIGVDRRSSAVASCLDFETGSTRLPRP